MAKQSYLGANVTGTDSFSGWIDKTNQVRNDMATIAVTVTTVAGAEPNTTNSGLTTGNAAIAGVLTANTIAVSQYLRGGTVTTSAPLVITSNAIFQGTLTYLTSANTTIGDSAASIFNVNAVSDFNANVNIDGVLTTTANTLFSGVNTTIGTSGSNILNINSVILSNSNATFSGALVNITSTNTTIGDAGTDILNVNAVSDFNANVNIDGILAVTSNAIFSGANLNINGNTTIGDLSTDILIVNSVLASDLIPLDTTIDLGTISSTYGNVHTLATYSKDIIVSNTVTVANTLTVNTQANTASLMVRNLTATRIPYIGTSGQFIDSANLIFSGTGLTITGNATVNGVTSTTTLNSGNTTITGTLASGNTTITGTLAANNTTITGALSATTLTSGNTVHNGTLSTGNTTITGTLGVTGLATLATANVTSTLAVVGATTLNSTLLVNNAITASNTLNVTGLTTLSSANVTVLATLASANVTGLATISSANVTTLATLASANVTGRITANTITVTGAANLSGTIAVSGIITASSDFVLSGTGARIIKVDSGTSALGSFNFVIANNTVGSSNTVLVANTTGLFASANATYDLGSSAVTWRNVYGREIIVANSLSVGGNTSIIGSLQVTGTITTTNPIDLTLNVATSNTSTVSSILTVNGNTVLGDSSSDIIQFNASANSSLVPVANTTYNLGNTANYWANIYSNNTVTNNIVQQYAVQSTQAVTIATLTETQITTFSSTTYGSAEVIITAKQGTNRHITKLLIVHNGTTAYATEYGSILTGTSLATYNVDISGGNVRILTTPTSTSSTTFNVALTLINA